MINIDFYNLLMDTSGALFGAAAARRAQAAAQEAPPPMLQLKRGLAESPAWFLIQALEFEPEPLSVTNLRVRDIYASESIVQALLELMASEKWFDRIKDPEQAQDLYTLTEAGRAALHTLRAGSREIMATLEPLPAAEIARLESLLLHLIEASLNSPEPPGIWCLARSRNRAPDPQAAPLVKIAQYFADFNAFRDDVHMAAWQPLGVEGYVWEAFSFVWAGTANSAEALFNQLAYRGYSRSDYAAALQALAERDWLTEAGSDTLKTYQLTEQGRTIREEAEQLTDEYFYGPWACLAEVDVGELHELLVRLGEGLQGLANG